MLKFLFKGHLLTAWTIALGLLGYVVISALLGVCLYGLLFDQKYDLVNRIAAVVGIVTVVIVDMLLEQIKTWRRAVVVFVADVLSLALPVWLVIHWCCLVGL